MLDSIRTRDDGILEGVRGPTFPCLTTRESIAQRMGWADSGEAAPVITRTMSMLAEGKAVRLTSHYGWCQFTPLAPDEDGTKIPAAYFPTYHGDGEVIQRLANATTN